MAGVTAIDYFVRHVDSEQIEQERDTRSTFVNCDLTNRADLETAVDTAGEFGGIDLMVNNAGIWHPDDFLEVIEDEYRQLMAVNLEGAYLGSQIAAQRMVEHDGGSIITISSIAGLSGNGNWPTYSASKGGLTLLTYSLAHRLAADGVGVNAIHPGSIETKIAGDQEISPEQVAAMLEETPLGRYGQPEESAVLQYSSRVS